MVVVVVGGGIRIRMVGIRGRMILRMRRRPCPYDFTILRMNQINEPIVLDQ